MFPVNPTINEQHIEKSKTFTFNGEGWVLQPDITFGDIVTHDASEFATEEQAVQAALLALGSEEWNINENARASAELIRISNENIRIESEELREIAKTNVIDATDMAFETNSIIQGNELIRISNEDERIESEELRVTSEGLRVDREVSRSTEEELRVTAENLRVNNETSRNTSEGIRVNSEIGRVNSEGLRADAEALRIAQYGLSQQATEDANDAADLANDAADNANNAADTLLSNVISLELKDDMHLYLQVPDVYEGFTFKVENGNLIAMV